MDIRIERLGAVAVLVLSGDLDSSMLDELDQRVDQLLDEGTRALLWDLGSVGLLPSSGIGFIIQTGRRLQREGGQMALTGAGRLARETLHTLGVLGVFAHYDRRAEAVAALSAQAR